MTGTALTEEREFREIYNMDVVEIPTNKPVARVDLEDAVYKTKKEKFNAVVDSVIESYQKGQPVLVGTITIDTSEMVRILSLMMRQEQPEALRLSVLRGMSQDVLITSSVDVQDVREIRVSQDSTFHLKMTL